MFDRNRAAWIVGIVAAALLPFHSHAQTLAPEFADDYAVTDLGSIQDLPPSYGGLFILPSQPDTLYIGGSANSAAGALYRVPLVRDGNDQITGFGGPATLAAPAPYIDGGITPDPGGLISYGQWPQNAYAQIDLATGTIVNQIDLDPFGVASSSSSVAFIPSGFPGAGGMRIASWSGGEFYEVDFSVGSGGIITIDAVTQVAGSTLPGGPEGWTYVAAGSPQFPAASMLVSGYSAGNVAAYEVDAEGNPVIGSRRVFLSGLSGAEGAALDPASGAFVFSTFGAGNRVIVVNGFVPPPVPAGTLMPGHLDFGDVTVGATSAAQILTLSSTGTAPLEIANATLAGVAYVANSDCPAGAPGLAPDASCTIEITCAPVAAAPQAGSYSLATNAGAFGSTLQCNGVAAPVAAGTLTPANLDFGDVTVGATSATQILTLASTGTASLEIADLALDGDAYVANTSCTTGGPGLAPGASCTIEIACAPAVAGLQAGTYSVNTNAGAFDSTLQCNGVPEPVAAGSLTPAGLDFGKVTVGSTSAPQVLTLTSTGSAPLEIASASLTGDAYVADSSCPAGAPGLAPGANCTIEIDCTPPAIGAQAGTYTLATNAGAFEAALQCNGISAGPAPPAAPVPLNRPWILAVMALLLMLVGYRRRPTAG
jgi:hypothetical protein